MSAGEPTHQYVMFHADRLVPQQTGKVLSTSDVRPELFKLLTTVDPGFLATDFTVEDVPSVEFHAGAAGVISPPPWTAQKVFSVASPDQHSAQRFRDAVMALIRGDGSSLVSIGVNPTITSADYSIPVAPDAALFGTLDDARSLIHADGLPSDLDGTSVNVVVIDAGIDMTAVPSGQFSGGWQPLPGGPGLPTPPLPGHTVGEDAIHGMMIVNNILAMAPKARIFDVPLIPPPKIFDICSFLHAAHAVYERILTDIQSTEIQTAFPGPWIFVNAWAIFDRRSEGVYLGEYTENLGPYGGVPHQFFRSIERAASENVDVVFCAGNCGEVCPDGRCGPDDYGPGRGIWGANAHRDVLTVGAVRVDQMWPGYSSEGPGPLPNLYAEKPDLCAPTQFVGTAGRYPPNTGTSASAAIAAGVISALRTRAGWNQTKVPPFILNAILNNAAHQTQGSGWNPQLGNGILDAKATYQQLLTSFP